MPRRLIGLDTYGEERVPAAKLPCVLLYVQNPFEKGHGRNSAVIETSTHPKRLRYLGLQQVLPKLSRGAAEEIEDQEDTKAHRKSKIQFCNSVKAPKLFNVLSLSQSATLFLTSPSGASKWKSPWISSWTGPCPGAFRVDSAQVPCCPPSPRME